jgi:hypothetical protein
MRISNEHLVITAILKTAGAPREEMPPPRLRLNRDTWEWEWVPFLAFKVQAGSGALRKARRLLGGECRFNYAVDVVIVSKRGREVMRFVNPHRPPVAAPRLVAAQPAPAHAPGDAAERPE